MGGKASTKGTLEICSHYRRKNRLDLYTVETYPVDLSEVSLRGYGGKSTNNVFVLNV